MCRFPKALAAFLAVIVAGAAGAPELNAQDPAPQPQPQQHEQHMEHAADSIVGQITQANEESLTVRAEDGRQVTFELDERTRVMDPTGRITDTDMSERIAALSTGDEVVVRFRTGDTPQERIATAIEIRDDRAVAARDREQPRPQQDRPQQDRPQQDRPQQERPQQDRQMPQHAADSLVGQIAAAHEDSVVVRGQDGRQVTFVVDQETEVKDPTGRIPEELELRDRIAQLSPGENVVVRYRTGETPVERIATAIEIRDGRDEGPRQQAQQPAQQQRPDAQQQRPQAQQQPTQTQQQERPQAQQPQTPAQQQQTPAERQRQQQQMQQQQQQLPATSGNLPLVTLLGLLGIMAATGVVVWGHRRG